MPLPQKRRKPASSPVIALRTAARLTLQAALHEYHENTQYTSGIVGSSGRTPGSSWLEGHIRILRSLLLASRGDKTVQLSADGVFAPHEASTWIETLYTTEKAAGAKLWKNSGAIADAAVKVLVEIGFLSVNPDEPDRSRQSKHRTYRLRKTAQLALNAAYTAVTDHRTDAETLTQLAPHAAQMLQEAERWDHDPVFQSDKEFIRTGKSVLAAPAKGKKGDAHQRHFHDDLLSAAIADIAHQCIGDPVMVSYDGATQGGGRYANTLWLEKLNIKNPNTFTQGGVGRSRVRPDAILWDEAGKRLYVIEAFRQSGRMDSARTALICQTLFSEIPAGLMKEIQYITAFTTDKEEVNNYRELSGANPSATHDLDSHSWTLERAVQWREGSGDFGGGPFCVGEKDHPALAILRSHGKEVIPVEGVAASLSRNRKHSR